MWENAYLSMKIPKASRALKKTLDPLQMTCFTCIIPLHSSEAGAPLTCVNVVAYFTVYYLCVVIFKIEYHSMLVADSPSFLE